jgi:hypothetical protein
MEGGREKTKLKRNGGVFSCFLSFCFMLLLDKKREMYVVQRNCTCMHALNNLANSRIVRR